MRNIIFARHLACLLLMVILMVLAACQGTPKTERHAAASPARQSASTSAPVKLMALDDPRNPFKGQYGPWDRWIMDNLSDGQPVELDSQGREPAGWISLGAGVNDDGVMLPLLEAQWALSAGLAVGNENYHADFTHPIRGEGIMDPEMYARYVALRTSIMASYFPSVPEWLAANPPRAAVLLPSGEVATEGPLGSGLQGSGKSAKQDSCCGGGDHYWLYSATGEPIESTPGHWWWIYFRRNNPGYDQELGTFNNRRRDGVVYFMKPGTEEIVSIWSWDGQRLPDTTPPPLTDSAPFVHLTAQQFGPLHEYQLNPIHKERGSGYE